MSEDDAPTYDRNAELSTLAAGLQSRPARDKARRYLTGADFHDPTHEVIWNTMGELDRNGRGVDPAVLMSTLQATNPHAAALLPMLVTYPAFAQHVVDYAAEVRQWATRRRLVTEAIRTQQQALMPGAVAANLAATVANRFAAIRDTGSPEDAESLTLGEVLSEPDDEPDWIIPGLLERADRMILTGDEGLGKSFLLRQVAVMATAGLDPFDNRPIEPISVLVVDCENSLRQVRRKVRAVVAMAARHGKGNPEQVNLLCSKRIDITADRDLARIHREVDACQPDLVIIGPLYRLVPRALQTDDEAAPMLAALDTIRDRGIALMMEAHAGHTMGKGNVRDLRPRGSSALLGWPEFGYGMRGMADDYAQLVPWRGDRDERDWPTHLRHASDGIRWVPADLPPPERAWA